MWEPEAHETRVTVFFFILVFTLTIAAGYVVLWFFWKGKNWARILVLLNCFVCFYNVLDKRISNETKSARVSQG